MASGEPQNNSPKEDNYTLVDDATLAQISHAHDDADADNESDCEAASHGTMLDEDWYHVMPPPTTRHKRRSMEKPKHRRHKTDSKGSAEKARPVGHRAHGQSSPSRGRCSNAVTCSVSDGTHHVTVDAPVDANHSREPSPFSAKKRKDSMKNFTTIRAYERDLKSSSSDLAAMDSPVQVQTMSVDTPDRFMCLNPRLVPPVAGNNKCDMSSQKPTAPPECPRDRIMFYKTFLMLINLGNSARKEKESKIGPYTRQLSCEQEVWQNEVNDLIWLELQAWYSGRTLRLQDEFLCEEREKVTAVLDEVVGFKVTRLTGCTDTASCEENSDNDGISVVCDGGASIVTDASPDAVTRISELRRASDVAAMSQLESYLDGCVWECAHALAETTAAQKEALTQVSALLDDLGTVEHLYPTTKALGKEYPLYDTAEFRLRVDTLCLWMNVVKDLGHKLQLMAKVLRVDKIDGLQWPWLDGATLCDAVDNATVDDTESDMSVTSYSTPDSVKNVRFNLSEASLTDITANEIQAQTSVSSSYRTTSVEDICSAHIYRHFVDRTLKKTGMRKLLMRLIRLTSGTLQRAKEALQKPKTTPSYADVVVQEVSAPVELSIVSSAVSLEGIARIPSMKDVGDSSLAQHGATSQQFSEMQLPSFKLTYLFLMRILLDVVHECLQLRLEQRPATDPSLLSVRQLIRECKEGLYGAVMMKQYYQDMVLAVMSTEDHEQTKLGLESFDEDMKHMMEVYFDYLQTWMCGLQNLQEMSKRLKNFLEEEWNFTKKVCPHIRSGDANAANRFCLMASSLLRSIADFLETGMDECINELYNSTLVEPEDAEQAAGRNSRQAIIQTCRRFKFLFHEARERASKALGFAKMLRKDLEIAAGFSISVAADVLLKKLIDTDHVKLVAPLFKGCLMFVPAKIVDDRQQIMQLLNVTSGREDGSATDVSPYVGYLILIRCAGAVGCKEKCPTWEGPTLRVELTAETAIVLSHIEVKGLWLTVTHSSQLVNQCDEFQHLMDDAVLLVNEQTSCHQAIADSLVELKMAAMDLRHKVADGIAQVDEKLNLDDITVMDEAEKHHIQKLYRETLHQCYGFGFEYHQEVIRLVTGEMRAKLAFMLVDFAKQWMAFVSEKCERGRGVRPRWASQGLDFLLVASEPRILAILTDSEFLGLKQCINNCITHVIGDKASPATAGVSYRVTSPDTTAHRHNVSRNVSCPEPARRPQSPSLSSARFVQTEPAYYQPGSLHLGGRRMTSPTGVGQGDDEFYDTNDNGLVMEISPQHSSSTDDIREEEERRQEKMLPMERIRAKVADLEERRSRSLLSRRVIGKVSSWKGDITYNINIRRVNFKWQRGNKIGDGQFGKVYAAVNMETGELMALKEVRFQPNDHQTIKDIADEIKIFEGISHPSLVKYYGIEVHRDEMLIFMEYCAEGTIEEVAKQGLPEVMVRKYTAEILIAITVLHDNGIVHRDIKESVLFRLIASFRGHLSRFVRHNGRRSHDLGGLAIRPDKASKMPVEEKELSLKGANIFLTSDGPLKLGDFGSAVKLKNHTTMPGEVNNLVGTAAFMAPEVITHNDGAGSGRASDIWSLGCVVIEMASGKRPWYELENSVMIMFRVGMGNCPAVPDSLSQEGKDFVRHCLVHEPNDRWTASQLQDHTFVKVYSDDETDCVGK